MQEGVHSGHRERLVKKFTEFPDSFSDHELLEMFLFPLLPRKDTNEIAHRLINAFGSIKKVFGATAEQLKSVGGVGDKTASYIVLYGKLLKKAADAPQKQVLNPFTSFENTKREMFALFNGQKSEKFYFFLLNYNYEVVFRMEYLGNDDYSVFADTAEIAKAISAHNAKFAIMAHNHPSGNEQPSAEDDIATRKFYILCRLHGINLVDHIIVSGDKLFSYFSDGKINHIKETAVF
ncbi:MAG: RadC family protein [Clostridia bacterium]|nr:RadC family protein [Clostridia bacterium]MBO4517348.1 RadC family protein [Clostridia bacterium]